MSGLSKSLPRKMHWTIIWASLGLGGVGILGAFGAHADVAAITAAWVAMMMTLAAQAGKPMEKDKALKIVAGVLIGIGGMLGGVKLANTYFAYTGVGTIAAIVINAGANAAVTYVTGRSAAFAFLNTDTGATVETVVKLILSYLGVLSLEEAH